MTDRFISPHPPPEGMERELLTIAAEECAEVVQRITKALRFGLPEIQPGQDLTNAQRIMREVGDLLAVLDMLTQRNILDPAEAEAGKDQKRRKLAIFLQADAAP